MFKRLALLAGIALCPLTTAAFAGTITDPAMSMDSGTLSDPLSTLPSTIDFGAAHSGEVGVYNDLGYLITALTFNFKVAGDLNSAQIDAFTCGATNPFFLHCDISYTNFTSYGIIAYAFWGVLPSDNDEIFPSQQPLETEVGEHEGLPPLPSDCLDNPEAGGHCDVGHFVLNFNGDTGNGWIVGDPPTYDADLFLPGGPLLDSIIATPEPASVFLFAGGLGLCFFLTRRRLGVHRAKLQVLEVKTEIR